MRVAWRKTRDSIFHNVVSKPMLNLMKLIFRSPTTRKMVKLVFTISEIPAT